MKTESPFDNTKARREGWYVTCRRGKGKSCGKLTLARIPGDRFHSRGDMVTHVNNQAARGSIYHLEALRIING